MKLSEIINATGANVINNYSEDFDVNISTDTRTLTAGDFYLPLKGESFDGEKFVLQALQKGAIGAFVTSDKIDIKEYQNKCILKVENTLVAYLKLANYRRNKLNFKVVAITGSSGKTTTKEIVAATLGEKFKTFKTPLNHNNEIGFCQTIFETPDDTEVLVLEMGMRGFGEIELLSKYSEPDITVISNVGTAHIGRLGSRENIAKAKCEITKYQRGNIFIAHNDDLIKKTVEFEGEKIFYSINDVKILEKNANYSKFEYKNNIYELNVGGDYNIENALAAINVGFALEMSADEIAQGLKNYKNIEKRWEVVTVGDFKVINDSYNANPDSMKAFVDTVFELYKNYILVLGDMGELGADEVYYHQQLGEYINSNKNLDKNAVVITVGDLSKNISDKITNCYSKHFDELEKAGEFIKNNLDKKSTIFLKASRSMKFERILDYLQK